MDDKRVFRDLEYSHTSDNQKLDLYLPAEEGVYPVIVLLHGGAFRFGDRTMPVLEPIFEATDRGYAVVSADYRTTRETVFPGPLADVKAALRWVRANAERYGLDPERIALWGESAGGYLALMAALTPRVAELEGDVRDNGEYPCGVRALVTYYPLVDFCELADDAGAVGFPPDYCGDDCCEARLMGHPIGDDEATRRSLWSSYTDRLPEDFSLKTLIQVGDADHMVPYPQSVKFARQLAEVTGEENVTLEVFPGAKHIDPVFFAEKNLQRVYDFLREAFQ